MFRWPFVLRRSHLSEIANVRQEIESEKSWLRSEMKMRLSKAVDSLPEKQMELDKLIRVAVKASAGSESFLNDLISLHAVVKVSREFATADIAINAILAQQIGNSIRSYLEQENNMNVPQLFADAGVG